MLVYRLCSARFTALDGEGSRLYGGRWNSPGIPVVYTAATSSLAILETRVHLRAMPVNYVLLTIAIGEKFEEVLITESIFDTQLSETRSIGDAYFRANATIPLRVPSVVAPAEFNFLFSPAYAEHHATILKTEPIPLDARLWA